jgi:hypothetical protein
MDTRDLSRLAGDFDAYRDSDLAGSNELVCWLNEAVRQISDLQNRVNNLETTAFTTLQTFERDAVFTRLTALEAQAQQPSPVASWLEQTVNLLAQFASVQQGEWASVQPVHIPEGVLPWRELEDALTDLADEIAVATAPAAAAETPAPAPTPETGTATPVAEGVGIVSPIGPLILPSEMKSALYRYWANNRGVGSLVHNIRVRIVIYPADSDGEAAVQS